MSWLKNKYLVLIVHSVTWLCLFLYPFLFHYLSFHDSGAVLRIALFLFLLIGFFYLNTGLLIPKVLGRKKVLLYLGIILFAITIISSGAGYIQVLLNKDPLRREEIYARGVNTGIFAGTLTWIISSGIKLTGEWFRNQQQMRIIENEKLNAELNFLKSQVNPHFLFNALNNIYALQNKNSSDTGPAILKLSQLARYMLYETSSEFVALDKEISYLKNYIELQKLGLSEQLIVKFSVDGDPSIKKIKPMLLIPLVENVFKHGLSYVSRSDLSISLRVNSDSIELQTRNEISVKRIEAEKANGIGLINLRKRLELLYPGKHELTIKKEGTTFFTSLKLNLK
jgi:two-component system, LytTR family, sensor kinase